jgi:hypothetical protein
MLNPNCGLEDKCSVRCVVAVASEMYENRTDHGSGVGDDTMVWTAEFQRLGCMG